MLDLLADAPLQYARFINEYGMCVGANKAFVTSTDSVERSDEIIFDVPRNLQVLYMLCNVSSQPPASPCMMYI